VPATVPRPPPWAGDQAIRTHPPAVGAAAPLPSTLVAVAALGLSALAAALVLTASGSAEHPLGRAAIHGLIIGAPVATGLYAIRSSCSRFGWQLMAAGFAWSLTILAEASSSLAYSTGRVAAWAIFPLLFYLILAFPDGRIRARRDRLLSFAITALVVVLFMGSALLVSDYPKASPWTSCGEACPANAFQVVSSEPGWVGSVLGPARDLLACLLLAGVTAVLAVRLRAASVVERVTTAPVLAVSTAVTLVLVAFIAVRRAAPDGELVRGIGLAWTLCLPAVAAGFSLGLVQRRLLVSDVLSGMSRSLRTSLQPAQIGDALRATLGVSAVEVLVRRRDGSGWIREDGSVTAPTDVPGVGRALREIREGPDAIAAIMLDADLDEDDELVDAIVSLAEAALREDRLKADLELSLHDLDDSRKRIAMAADVERRRIERDLHDGAQQRLIALRMRLSLVEDLVREDRDAASRAIHDLADDVDRALEEIRSLAQGIYPALLADRGLADALRSVGRRSPLTVDVRAAGLRRLAPELETAVYFTCLEALQNAAKHADGATRARISLEQGSRMLTFDVTDDGGGFDPVAAPAGAGLRNMRDRVESIGGTLAVESSRGHGTAIRGVVPLGGMAVS
jgi:signal transduction histidine kinase